MIRRTSIHARENRIHELRRKRECHLAGRPSWADEQAVARIDAELAELDEPTEHRARPQTDPRAERLLASLGLTQADIDSPLATARGVLTDGRIVLADGSIVAASAVMR